MLDGDNKIAKYFYVLPKLTFVVYLLLAVNNITSNVLLFTISSPLLFAVANAMFIFTKNSKAKDKLLLLATAIIYAVIIVLFLLVNKYIIYANFAIVIIEIFLIAKLKLNTKQKITKAVILSIPVQLLFVAISFSMYHTYLKPWLFIIFVVIMSLFSLALSISVSKLIGKENSSYASRHIAKKFISTILIMIWIVPFMYSYLLRDDGLIMKLEFMIYGLILAIYPYATMLLAINKKTY
jgi:hypothetical protein